jgi:hypothetical protein
MVNTFKKNIFTRKKTSINKTVVFLRKIKFSIIDILL